MTNNTEFFITGVIAGVLAMLVGIGKLLQSDHVISTRILIGRALVHLGLGLSAFAVLALVHDIPMPAVVGLAMVVASVGESMLERVVNKYIGSDKDD